MNILVCGGGGFIGHHLCRRLQSDGYHVTAVGPREPVFDYPFANEFIVGDLRDAVFCRELFSRNFQEVYQLAADMGGAGYLFSGENDSEVMKNSALINLNVLEACRKNPPGRILFSSSACVYPKENQLDTRQNTCAEASAYPANPDSEYGWEKLFSERLFLAGARNYGLSCAIARYHTVYGTECPWTGGKEKVPAALCRKIAQANDGDEIEIWGDGLQTRSFLYIDDCLEATVRLARSKWLGPVNIGSEELVAINDLASAIAEIAQKRIRLIHTYGPLGVRGRCSDNTLIRQQLGWEPKTSLQEGLRHTYDWISTQVEAQRRS